MCRRRSDDLDSEEPYQWQIIRDFGLRGIIGKGGMGDKTLAACKEHGCVYLHAVGGAAQVLAECIEQSAEGLFHGGVRRAGGDLGVRGGPGFRRS